MKKSSVVLLSVLLVIVTFISTFAVFTIFSKTGLRETISDANALSEGTSIASSKDGVGIDSVAVGTNKKGEIVLTKAEYDELSAAASKYEDLKRFEDMLELLDYIKEMYYKDVTEEKLIEGAKKGLFSILGDPYSVYMNPEEYTSFVESISGEFPGIGVYVTPNPETGIEIISPIEDTPAFKAGLKPLDVIKAVNGVEYTHEQMDEAIKNIRGEVGTKVTITIFRPSTGETFDVTITRALIIVKVVKSEMLENGIGYLRLTQFDSHAYEEFYQHMDGLIAKGAKGVIIDLRDNPGGSLSECLDICDVLLPKQLICSTKGRGPNTTEAFWSDDSMYNVELVLLINEGSASASEILAGAIKDNKRGELVGTKSFGKGIVQTFMPYMDGGFKITTSEYFTPSGINIHGIGIEPHHVEVLSEKYKALENPTPSDDNQLQKALEVLRKKLKK